MLNVLIRPTRGILPSIARAASSTTLAPAGCVSVSNVRCFNSSTPIVESFSPREIAASTTAEVMRQGGNIETVARPLSSATLPSATASLSSAHIASLRAAPVSVPAVAADESVVSFLPLLAAQPAHYIALHIHGKPYLVTPGDSIRLPFKMPGVVAGDVLRFDRASIIGSRDFTLKGQPWVNQAFFECRAIVIGTESEPMRLKIKKKQRERRTKTVKSKHKYTVLRISELKILSPEFGSEVTNPALEA